MGRELRRVPPNWNHPRDERGNLQPMCNENFANRFARWLDEFDRIRRGDLDEIERKCYAQPGMIPLSEWLRDEGAPDDPAYFRPWSDDEATWFQVWETVSEGTPVTPPFATKAELVAYLVEGGDDWDRKRGRGGYTREQAEAFVADGWAPSMVISGGRMAQGIEIPAMLNEGKG